MDYIHELDNFIIESDICMLENAMQIQSLNEAEKSDKFRKIFSAMKERISKLFESFIEFVQKKLKGIKEKILSMRKKSKTINIKEMPFNFAAVVYDEAKYNELYEKAGVNSLKINMELTRFSTFKVDDFMKFDMNTIKEKIEDYMHDKEIYNEEDLNGVISLNISDYLKEKEFNNTGKFIMEYLNELNDTLERIMGQEGYFENTRKRLISILSKLSSEPATSDSDSIKAKEIKYQYFTRLLNSSITTLKLYKLCINIVDTAVTNVRKQFNERAPFDTSEPDSFTPE